MFNFKEQAELVFQKKIVMGVTKFKGEIDGNEIDSCTVLIATPLNDSTGNAKGFGVGKLQYGTSDDFRDFDKLEFPCELEMAFQTVTNSQGKTKQILRSIRPVQTSSRVPKE